MSPLTKTLAAAAVLAFSPPLHAQGLLTEKNLSLEMALTIAQTALQKCESLGFKVAAAVVDRAGLTLVMLRGDGAGLHTPEGAERKAYTARTYRSPSANFAKRVTTEPSYAPAVHYQRVLALAGGLPIKVGNDVVGAIGISGSPGQDDVCAQAGIDKVADALK